MNKFQEKAWNILSEDEKTAITLQLGYTKSTWQAGEIMGKAHYKYIEIQERAHYFFKRFTEHFRLYDSIIPADCKLSSDVKRYFKVLISRRCKTQEALLELKDSPLLINYRERNMIIKNQLNWLEESKHSVDLNTLAIIKDYDRWNNFRILPPDCQEASAFKRRNKNRNKRDIKNFFELNPYAAKKISETYCADDLEIKVFYVPVYNRISNTIEAVKIPRGEKSVNKISTAGLYIFHKEEQADEFMELAIEYYFDPKNDCKKGLKFWPKFRKSISIAINYDIIQNLVNSRKHIKYNLKELL